MSIQDLGSVGELIAAIATVATLLYLATQIRQNTKSVQSSNFSTWIDAVQGINQIHLEIAEFLEDALYAKRELTPDEKWRFHIHQAQLGYSFESVFLFHLNGTVDDKYFASRMRSAKKSISYPGSRIWWDEWAQHLYDERFIKYIDGELAEGS